jgi:hypothetical protein
MAFFGKVPGALERESRLSSRRRNPYGTLLPPLTGDIERKIAH